MDPSSCEQELCVPISLLYFLRTLSCEQELCEPMSLLHSSRASSCEQKLCEPISLLHSSRVSSCEQKLCEPISLLYSSRASSCEQKLCEPISLSLERALSSETGSQDPCSAHHAVAAWEHFMLLWCKRGSSQGRQHQESPAEDRAVIESGHLQEGAPQSRRGG